MRADEVEVGRAVRLFAPMSDAHGHTGVIVQVRRDEGGRAVAARVALDGRGESCWLHRDSLQPLAAERVGAASGGLVYPLEVTE